MAKAVLVDLTRCIGCRGCQVACKEWNELEARKTKFSGDYTNPTALNSDCYTHIMFHEQKKNDLPVWNFIKNQCLHCKEPACVSACPVTALIKTETGPVVYDFDRCIGCRYCMMACPFQIPKYEWESTSPWVQKCTFCSERIRDGLKPACIKVCPTETMYYDEHENVVTEAKRRINSPGQKYTNYIYGLNEAGGTSWMYISKEPFEEIGFRMNVPKQAVNNFTWEYISHIPWLFGIVFTLGLGSYLITREKENKE